MTPAGIKSRLRCGLVSSANRQINHSMWEESCESISVRHRRVSEVREGEGGASDSEDDFVLVPEAGQS